MCGPIVYCSFIWMLELHCAEFVRFCVGEKNIYILHFYYAQYCFYLKTSLEGIFKVTI